MVVLQIQQFNGFVNYASRARTSRGRGRASTTVCVQTQVAPSTTQKIMENISVGGEAGGAGGAYSYNALKRLDNIWSNICTQPPGEQETQQIVSRISGFSQDYGTANNLVGSFDIAVCGGTLGIFLATALCAKGLKVAVVERNAIKGRDQEWNISRKEMKELIQVGVLTEEEIEEVIAAKFNPNRCGFENLGDIWVEDILNLGVSPAKLVETVKRRFISLGGVILEDCSLSSILIYDDLAVMQLSKGDILSSRLVIDAMGNFSPILKQIKGGRKPDGMCLVVGSCAHGFNENSSSDVIYSSSSVTKVADSNVQLFWEAFPAGSGPLDRTTYMFTYTEPQSTSPSLEDLLEEYWKLMPKYQGVSLDELEILRVVYGIFPTYRNSPLQAAFDRVLQFGDASGIQSPVSFGGFGSLTRHLGRLSNAKLERIMAVSKSNVCEATTRCLPWLHQRASPRKFQLHAEIGRSGSQTISSGYNTVWSSNKDIRPCHADQTSDHSIDLQTGWDTCSSRLVSSFFHAGLVYVPLCIYRSSNKVIFGRTTIKNEVPVEETSRGLEIWSWPRLRVVILSIVLIVTGF